MEGDQLHRKIGDHPGQGHFIHGIQIIDNAILKHQPILKLKKCRSRCCPAFRELFNTAAVFPYLRPVVRCGIQLI